LRDILVFVEYLDTGLVPSRGFAPSDIEEFEAGLRSLSIEERRSVNRKFRKIFRKLVKKKLMTKKSKGEYTEGMVRQYGYGASQPTKRQLRARRRFVHQEILDQINKRIRNEP
jgi:hypothetical protein